MKKLEQDEKVALSLLLQEIEDASLESILRSVIFNDEEVHDAIKADRPEYNGPS